MARAKLLPCSWDVARVAVLYAANGLLKMVSDRGSVLLNTFATAASHERHPRRRGLVAELLSLTGHLIGRHLEGHASNTRFAHHFSRAGAVPAISRYDTTDTLHETLVLYASRVCHRWPLGVPLGAHLQGHGDVRLTPPSTQTPLYHHDRLQNALRFRRHESFACGD